ncbi:hypothetical protein ACFXJ8_05225 [Nonomuraea sp. NPDC059194]|uniref:hypothetical protein n=1 Tax=Nonomuraea sp. NPDC059194 TaxID=3346764 RepID=UPI0036AFAAAE
MEILKKAVSATIIVASSFAAPLLLSAQPANAGTSSVTGAVVGQGVHHGDGDSRDRRSRSVKVNPEDHGNPADGSGVPNENGPPDKVNPEDHGNPADTSGIPNTN